MSTIRDVARLAGVSIATVSRVLNGQTNVTVGTQALETLLGLIEEKNNTSGLQRILPLELRCRESAVPPHPS